MTRKYFVKTSSGSTYLYGFSHTHEEQENIEQELDELGLDYSYIDGKLDNIKDDWQMGWEMIQTKK